MKKNEENLINSKEIICPKCKEETSIYIDNYKIHFNICKNKCQQNICFFKEFWENQKIENKDDIINQKNICLECNQKSQLCNSIEKHKIVDYNKFQNYICENHYKKYSNFCQNCNKDFCDDCINEHKNSQQYSNHTIIIYNDIIKDYDLEIEVKNLNEKINKYKEEINKVISSLKETIINFETYFNICSNYFNDHNFEFKNYLLLNNIKEFVDFNKTIKNDIDEIINKGKIADKLNGIIDINYNFNDNNFITSGLFIKKDQENSEVRIINSYEQAKREDKINIKEKDEPNENEIKEICNIRINNKIIPFSYTHKFENEGKYIIQYSFKRKLKNANYLFYDCKLLEKIDFSNFNSENITNMSHMFAECPSLTSINLLNINTNNVMDMSYMFYYCESLKNLDLSGFNTENVVDMNHMFYYCQSLESLNLRNFKTRNVIDMSHMFYYCESLKDLDIKHFKTENVKDMRQIFFYCESLKSIDIKNFYKKNLLEPNQRMTNCKNLKIIDK